MDSSIERIDILNRNEFINRTVQIIELISSHRGNITFSINGEWGCGKTFVLDEIQKRLINEEDSKYLVIPYNCWQYDYYDEPLVAIVSALLDYEESISIVSEDMKHAFKNIAKFGLSIAAQVVKNKIGIDIKETIESAKAVVEGTKEDKEKAHAYDNYYSLKKALFKLKESIAELAENRTIVFAVDELDRCLPEYAIKVLERLHHITEDIPNMITVIAVDESRLKNTVESIFGDGNAESYLKKFIRFELSLDKGNHDTQKFFEKFADFSKRFDESLYNKLDNTGSFITEVFNGVDIRSQEHIIEKATLLHDICFGDERQDYTIMYMELFVATLYYYHHDESIFLSDKWITNRNDVFGCVPALRQIFNSDKSGFHLNGSTINHNFGVTHAIIDSSDIFRICILYWYYLPDIDANWQHGEKEIVPNYNGTEAARLGDNMKKLSEYVKLLKTIA